MAKQREHEEPYFQRLAAHMVREDRDCWQAATDMELGLTTHECASLLKNKAFQRILRSERTKLYNELANDPARGKDTLVGQAMFSIEKLLESEQWDKALTGILSLAKIQGFVGADTNVNLFTGLSTRDLESLKTKLKEKALDQIPGNA